MDYEHIDFPAAVRKLAPAPGIPVIEERGGRSEDDRQHEARRTLLKLHAEAAEWFHENLMKRELGRAGARLSEEAWPQRTRSRNLAARFCAGQLGRAA